MSQVVSQKIMLQCLEICLSSYIEWASVITWCSKFFASVSRKWCAANDKNFDFKQGSLRQHVVDQGAVHVFDVTTQTFVWSSIKISLVSQHQSWSELAGSALFTHDRKFMWRKRGHVKLEPSPCQHCILLQVQRKITASTCSRSSTYSARFDVTTKTQIEYDHIIRQNVRISKQEVMCSKR